jgi:acetyltransferase-like isoleucine patch superfamily enzyme
VAYLCRTEMASMGFKRLGSNVKISNKASIYEPNKIEIGHDVRIDDFCVLSGSLKIGNYVHITPMCLLAGGQPGIVIDDFSTLAYGVKIFSQSDDYSGETMCNSLIPKNYKSEILKKTVIGRQVIIGANSTVLPGADIAEGCAIGAMSLVLYPLDSWGIYAGIPVRRLKERDKNIIKLEAQFLTELRNDTV